MISTDNYAGSSTASTFSVRQKGESVSTTIVEKISELTGVSIEELELLHSVIDPDALDILVDSLETGQITFEYADCWVIVDADGAVEIRQ